jgi:hypothetical protein
VLRRRWTHRWETGRERRRWTGERRREARESKKYKEDPEKRGRHKGKEEREKKGRRTDGLSTTSL